MTDLTARQIIEGKPDLFRPERAGRANAVVQFKLTGEGGGNWYVTIKDLSLIHISEPTRQPATSRMPSSA